MAVLVCGGAGYIGSHAVLGLIDNNEDVIVVDNLKTGFKQSVSKDAKFIKGDLLDSAFLEDVFKQHKIESVIHFAAYSLVGESVGKPFEYYENNVCGTLNLLNAMNKHDVRRIVFSSTAATYGEPSSVPILETDRTIPENPYGETKLAIEKALKWFDLAYGIKHIILRYFNVAGADKSGKIGEAHNPETHLIPIVLKTALGQREAICIFGDDYDTFDGTCIRDYIHVTDLAHAHILAMNSLRNNMKSNIYNLGNGNGFSVKQVIDTAKKVTGRNIPVIIEKRRQGDPTALVASSHKIISELGFTPKYGELSTIIESAWKWHLNNPLCYERT